MLPSHDIVESGVESLIEYLVDEKPGVAQQRKIATFIIEKTDLHLVCRYLETLAESEKWLCRSFSCYLLPHCFRIEKYRGGARKYLLELADDEDWRVRESAAWAFYKLLRDGFDDVYPLLNDWGTQYGANTQRAIIIAAMKMGKHREKKYAKPLFDLIELFLTDKDPYVQKGIIFALGDGLLRYYPDCAFLYLRSWIRSNDAYVRWIVAMSLSTAEAKKHMEGSLEILRELSLDNRKLVQDAVIRALTRLAQDDPKSVCQETRQWNHNPSQASIVSRVMQNVGNRRTQYF